MGDDVRHIWNNERRVIDRLVDAVVAPATKRGWCEQRLLELLERSP